MKVSFRARSLFGSALVLALLQFGQMPPAAAAPRGHSLDKSSVGANVRSMFGRLPLSFEQNMGQAPGDVEFLARSGNYSAFLGADEMVLAFSRPHPPESDVSRTVDSRAIPRGKLGREGKMGRRDGAVSVLQVQFAGAASGSGLRGLQQLPGKINYFLGNDPAHWHTDVPTFAQVENKNLYPGIGLRYHSDRGAFEYDFVVSPGSDPSTIQLRLRGAGSLRLTADGDVAVELDGGELRLKKPLAYQEERGTRKLVEVGFVLNGVDQVAFRLGAYDHRRTLVIDPVVIYSTLLGGNIFDGAAAIAVDASRNAYVTGYTNSLNFPVTPGALQTVFCACAFVTKFNATGTALFYSTYLGSGNPVGFETDGYGIAVDSSGNAYVTGETTAWNFPTTANAFSMSAGSSEIAFLSKLNPSGSKLLYSSYLGGQGVDTGSAVAADNSGNAYVGGSTGNCSLPPCTAFPTTPGAFQTVYITAFPGGLTTSSNAFVAHFDTMKSGAASLIYSTLLGGSIHDYVNGIALLKGRVYVTGRIDYSGFPVTPGAFEQSACPGGVNGAYSCAFVTEFNASGSGLIYSTYLGGSFDNVGNGIAVDLKGNAYIVGQTNSLDFPIKHPLQATNLAGVFGTTAFVAKLNPAGSALIYSTYLGGSTHDVGEGIAVDVLGNAYVTGQTSSVDFPTLNPIQVITGGSVFVSVLNKLGDHLLFSTYLGGPPDYEPSSIAVGPNVDCGEAYVAGTTESSNFPTTPGAFQTTLNGPLEDAFVTKIGIFTCP